MSDRPFGIACVATVLSGVAAMFYQLAWVRELTGVTTAATIALVLVLAAFMAGLGLGAWLGGIAARHARRPLVIYALVELAAAALFLLGIELLPASLALQHALIDAGVDTSTALAAQLGAVALYLVAATTLLGMALPLLIAGLDDAVVRQRASYNVIYGLNTLGAVGGTLVCGYVTIEAVGLDRSILFGAASTVASAMCALLAGGPERVPASTDAGASAVPGRLLAVAFATGAIALAAEVVWVRMLSLVMLNTVYASTQVLAAVLLGIAIAGFAAAAIARSLLRSDMSRARLVRVAFGGLIVAALWMSAVPLLTRTLAASEGFAALAASGQSPKVIGILLAILVPSSGLVALALPLLIAAAGARDSSQSLAKLFAVNTAGAVVGAVVMGLVVLPAFGLEDSELALIAAVIAAALLLPGTSLVRALTGVVAAGICFVLHTRVMLPEDLYALRFERGERILGISEGVTSTVLVTEDSTKRRRIWINSAWVAGTGGGHALLGHLPALSVDRLDRALGIALGTGQTFAAVLEHGATHLDCVEINEDVVTLARRWFSESNRDLFDHSAVHVHLQDGRAFLRAARDDYDLIALEPLQAWSEGTTALYTRQFYADARQRLRAGGVLAQWIPFYGQSSAATRAMVATALSVFPEASLWLDDQDGILLLYNGPFRIPWHRLANGPTDPVLGELFAQRHLDARGDVLSLFLMGPRGLASWTKGAEILDDDRPFLEYAAARDLGKHLFVPILTSTLGDLEDPRAYLDAPFDTREVVRTRHATLSRMLCPPERLEGCAAQIEADLGSPSQRLHYQYRQLILSWAEYARPVRAGREAILARGIAHDADFGEAMVNLAMSLAERGQRAAAIELAVRAAAIPRTRANAEAVLARLRPAQ
ncbi:MAG: hypothetical protein H0T46_31435 [Deltaproteobacteria bacterium]|nr:hypothetical protein [Deltaproteobacteria bacterium]